MIGATLGAVRPAGAGPIVLEAYGGERPADADRLLAPVLAELERGGFPAPRQVAAQVEDRLSRSAGAPDQEEVAAALAAIEAGYKQYLSGQFEPAIAGLGRGLAALSSAPAAVIGQGERREAILRGLVGLAMSHRRLGRQTEATAAMAELVRSFPDREISYKDYGPEPRDFYQKVQRELGADGKGSLAIDVDDDRTVVFINERYAGVGDVTATDLYPGRYRVFVQQGGAQGRVHLVDVQPDTRATLALSWRLDAALQSGERGVWLALADEETRTSEEPRLAVRVARAVGATSVVVLGIRDNRGRRSVVGAVYSADSTRPLRSGAVAVEPAPPADDRLVALGRLLAGDEAAAALVAPLGDAAPAPGGHDRVSGAGGRPLRTWKWITLGAGLAAAGTGAALIAAHEPAIMEDGSRNPSARNTRTAGIITAAAGGALTAVGIYFFVRDAGDRRATERAAAVVPLGGDGAALVISGRF